jgi:hypothetical protein
VTLTGRFGASFRLEHTGSLYSPPTFTREGAGTMRVIMIQGDARGREKPCLRCGYSLRKIDSTHCPECGLSVWLSLNQNDTLEMCSADWLRRMAVALWVMAGASLLAIPAMGPGLANDFYAMTYRQRVLDAQREWQRDGDDEKYFAARRSIVPERVGFDAMRIGSVVGAIALAGYCAGLFLLTGPEGRYPDRLARYRATTLIVCGAAALTIAWAAYAVVSGPPRFPEWPARVIGAVAALTALGYLRHLARRMPNKRLARASTWLMIGPAVSLFYAFVRHAEWPPDVFPLLVLPACAVLFVASSVGLRRAAKLADVNWVKETSLVS